MNSDHLLKWVSCLQMKTDEYLKLKNRWYLKLKTISILILDPTMDSLLISAHQDVVVFGKAVHLNVRKYWSYVFVIHLNPEIGYLHTQHYYLGFSIYTYRFLSPPSFLLSLWLSFWNLYALVECIFERIKIYIFVLSIFAI